MSRFTLVLAALSLLGNAAAAAAQETTPIPEERQAKKLPRQHLSGLRFGFTTFTGEVADLRDQAGLEPIMTQFGWQCETQIVSLTGGNQALMEWVLLVGGVQQDEFNVSLGWLTGYCLANVVEFGVGPNFSVHKDSEDITTNMVLAGGVPFGDFYLPVNVAVGIARGAPHITMLTGWIIG